MSENHVEDQLVAYVHAELPAEAEARVGAHLKSCAGCGAVLRSLEHGHGVLSEATRLSAPERVWDRIQADLRTEQRNVLPMRRHRALWIGAAAVAAAALIAVVLLPRSDSSRVALDPYFTRVEQAESAPDAAAIGVSTATFRPVEPREALHAAGMGESNVVSPMPGFSLWAGRVYDLPDGQVVQLLYRDQEDAFSVFMAPHSAQLDFGTRQTGRVRMGDWECTQIESETLALFWSVSGERQSVLVARADDAFDVASILRFFVYGGWEQR